MQVGEDGATGFIKRSDLGRDRDEQRPDRFQVGGKVDALVIGFDRSKKPNFSIKALQAAKDLESGNRLPLEQFVEFLFSAARFAI